MDDQEHAEEGQGKVIQESKDCEQKRDFGVLSTSFRRKSMPARFQWTSKYNCQNWGPATANYCACEDGCLVEHASSN
jgi:hypothetical protein